MKFRLIRIVLVLAILFAALPAPAAQAQEAETPPVPQTFAELEQAIQDTLSQYHVPGAQAILVGRDEILWSGAFGLAEVATQAPVTEQTRFRIGSISKTFVALSALKLSEEGKLSLEARLAEIAPEIAFNNPWEATHPVQLANLLEHTAGFTDLHLADFAYSDPAITLQDGLAIMAKSRNVGWQPGSSFLYSSVGTSTAAYMVEKAAGQRFEDYVQANFFDALEMPSATYFYPEDGQIARSYETDGITPQPYIHIIARPAGSINATAQDMAHLVQFMLQRGAYNGQQLLNAESLTRMETPTTSLAAQHGVRLGYGLCLENNKYHPLDSGPGFVFYGHSGAIDGFLADYGYLPEAGVGYFFAINAPNFEAMQQIAWLVQAYLTKDLTPPAPQPTQPLSTADLQQYAGYYELSVPVMPQFLSALEPVIALIRIEAQDGKLALTQLAGPAIELIPVGNGLFRNSISPAADAVIVPDGQGVLQLQVAGTNLRAIPAWNALFRMGSALICLLLMVSVLLYALFWLPRWAWRKLRRSPALPGNSLRLLPLLTVLCPVAMAVTFGLASGSEGAQLALLGHPTAYSIAILLFSLLFALVSVVSLARALRLLRRKEIPLALRIYTLLVSLASLATVVYLALHGAIGMRTWA